MEVATLGQARVARVAGVAGAPPGRSPGLLLCPGLTALSSLWRPTVRPGAAAEARTGGERPEVLAATAAVLTTAAADTGRRLPIRW